LQSALPHQAVELQPGAVALPVPQPADARRQSLDGEALDAVFQPAPQTGVVAEELEHGAVGAGDVGRVARQCDPAERSASLAALVAYEGGHEARVGERVGEAALARERPRAVAVIGSYCTGACQGGGRAAERCTEAKPP